MTSTHLSGGDEHTTRPAHDAGTSFVELLVAIVLLGTIVVATLAGLRASIVGTNVDENSARAHAWLQAAGDELHLATYLACDSNTTATIEAAYQTAVDLAAPPNEWVSGTVSIVSVEFLSGPVGSSTWGTTCASGDPLNPLYSQLVTIRVTDPVGAFSREVAVIKSV
jgi:type II secretory pathway pseudopilin PulG